MTSRCVKGRCVTELLVTMMLGWFVALAVGCASDGFAASDSRYFAAQAAMMASGMTQVGAVSRGSLRTSQKVKVPIELAADCYAFVAVGDSGVQDMRLVVRDTTGKQLATDQASGPDATATLCADRADTYWIELTMLQGAGAYTMAAWSGAGLKSPSSAPTDSGVEAQGTCTDPIPLSAGTTIRGDLSKGVAEHSGKCRNRSGEELVYRLDIATASTVTITVWAREDVYLYIRKDTCSQPDNEVECVDESSSNEEETLSTSLSPGTYYVFVDLYSDRVDGGRFRMSVNVEPDDSSEDDGPTGHFRQDVFAPLVGQADRLLGTTDAWALAQPLRVLRSGEALTGMLTSRGPVAAKADRGQRLSNAFLLPIEERSRFRIVAAATSFPVRGSAYITLGSDMDCDQSDCADIQRRGWGGSKDVLDLHGIAEPGVYRIGLVVENSGHSLPIPFSVTTAIAPVTGTFASDRCENAFGLGPSQHVVHVDPIFAQADVQMSCAPDDAADVVYRLDVRRPSLVEVFERPNFGPDKTSYALSLQRVCGAAVLPASDGKPSTEIACGKHLHEILPAGTYWLVVKYTERSGYHPFSLRYSQRSVESFSRACSRATPIRANHPEQRVLRGLGSTFGGAFGTAFGTALDARSAGKSGGVQPPSEFYKFTVPRGVDSVSVSIRSDAPVVHTLYADCHDAIRQQPRSTRTSRDGTQQAHYAVGARTYYLEVQSVEEQSANPAGTSIDLQISHKASE